MTDLYGLGCDNVVEHEVGACPKFPHIFTSELNRPQVIIANGTLVTASAEQHSDLHWALKGGANNFGK